jgi:hypothetical protein
MTEAATRWRACPDEMSPPSDPIPRLVHDAADGVWLIGLDTRFECDERLYCREHTVARSSRDAGIAIRLLVTSADSPSSLSQNLRHLAAR